MPPVKKKLGELLVEAGAVDALQLQAALGHQQQWGVRIGRALIDRGFCKPADVLKALSLQTGHPAVDLDSATLDSRLAFALGVKAAEKHRAVPLRLEGKRSEVLVVAASAPAGMDTLDAIRAVSGKSRIVIQLADDEAIERAIGKLYYGRQPVAPAPPPPQPMNQVEIQGESEIELDAGPPEARPAPGSVLVYGWKDTAAQAIVQMLQKASLGCRVANEDEVMKCTARDVLVTTSLSLEALLPPGKKLPGTVVVAGMPNDEDMQQARGLGATMYLRSPLNTEQLVAAVKRGLAEPKKS